MSEPIYCRGQDDAWFCEAEAYRDAIRELKVETAAAIDDLIKAWVNGWEVDQELYDQASALRDRLERELEIGREDGS